MILTLFCQILLIGTCSTVDQQNIPIPITPSRNPPQPLPSSLSFPLPSVRDTKKSPSSVAFSTTRGTSNTSINRTLAPNNRRVKPLSTARSRTQPSTFTYTRTTRDNNPKAQPQLRSSDWLIPPFNPSTRTPGGVVMTSSSYNTNFNGLAYRSILPIRNSNVNHYTGLYRNKNLFSNGENNGNNDDYNFSGHNAEYEKVSPQDKNDISVNLDSGDFVNPSVNSFTTLATASTSESRPKSALATEAGTGSVSSTLEMTQEYVGQDRDPVAQAVVSRDAIGGINPELSVSPSLPIPKTRQPKIHNSGSQPQEEQDSSIVFPGSIYRPPSKRPGNARPGKASNPNSDDDYAPPPLKALDKAAFESLKILLETRRISQALNSRTANPNAKIENSLNGQSNLATAHNNSPLDIKGRPKCATQNSGYCDEIDTYPKDFFDQVLKNSLTITPDVFQEVFGDSIDNKTLASDLSGRDGLNLMLDSPLCSSIEHTIYPKVAENKDGKFMYIVNHDEYIQGVRVEKCVKEGSPCMYLEGSLTGYQSACRQKYIYRKLLAFTRDGKATTDTFRLPACCVCHVRSVFVDDRINTAGFGSDNVDVVPASMVLPKSTGDNSTTQEDHANITFVEVLDDRLSDSIETATEFQSHDDGMHFPTVLPDTSEVDIPKNDSSILPDEGGGATVPGDPVAAFRSF